MDRCLDYLYVWTVLVERRPVDVCRRIDHADVDESDMVCKQTMRFRSPGGNQGKRFLFLV